MRRATPLLFGLILAGLLAAGCTSGTDETTTSSETTIPATTTTSAQTTTTEAAAASDASCVACHTDQATLQAMAVEPVAAETLSEGEG